MYHGQRGGSVDYFGRRNAMVPADAADLLSETFVVAWRRGDPTPVESEQARMWLFGVARRVRANAARGAARRYTSRTSCVRISTATDRACRR